MLFNNINIAQREVVEIEERLSNWVKLSESLEQLTELQLLKYLYVEKITRKRLYILTRLKSRFNVVRNERENNEIMNL